MAEKHWKCRWHPRCTLHLGEPRPRKLSYDNLTEMAELHQEGWRLPEIAEAFEVFPQTVADILRKLSESKKESP